MEIKCRNFNVRFTEEEHRDAKQRARRHGVPFATLLRTAYQEWIERSDSDPLDIQNKGATSVGEVAP